MFDPRYNYTKSDNHREELSKVTQTNKKTLRGTNGYMNGLGPHFCKQGTSKRFSRRQG